MSPPSRRKSRAMPSFVMLEPNNPFERTPERKLCAAVLLRAIIDFLSCKDEKDRKTALHWLFHERDDAIFSYKFVCLTLELDSEDLREMIKGSTESNAARCDVLERVGVHPRHFPTFHDIEPLVLPAQLSEKFLSRYRAS